ncbi:hypothetical protein [Microbacterium sp. 2FI]|uniref:hypothetical protein n=1 Tax=Microbacterium sp. 2FI TaxID=2502193 RepID=UPI0010F6F3FF|nr:hypothetical protein [Microbacterium sp. 2FI]
MSDDARRSRVPLIALLAAIGLVVVIALVAVLARSAPPEYDPDSPEGVVQLYSQAVVDGDVEEALTYLVPDVADACERLAPDADDTRVTLVATSQADDTARVEVIVTEVYGSGLLGSDEYDSDEEFELRRIGGDWLIEFAPWQLALCVEGAR